MKIIKPREARSVLPNSLKTEVVMTANIREWRHFLKLRTDSAAHPQMREVSIMLLDKLKSIIPVGWYLLTASSIALPITLLYALRTARMISVNIIQRIHGARSGK